MGKERLISAQFHGDKRVLQAKLLLQEALADHQKSLAGVKGADPELEKVYQDLLQAIGEYRGRSLVYPYLASGIGKGALVELADGSIKYDFITGIGVHYLGHSHEKLLEAGVDAALEDTIMQGHLQQNVATVALLKLLVEAATRKGGALKHCFLTSSGAMANENALKIIFQKKYPANRLLAFARCFAGRSLATAQITDKAANRKGLPKTVEVDYIPFFDSGRPKESIQEAVGALNAHLARYPGQHAAMCFELIQGEGGYYPGDRSFFSALMEILKAHQVAVLVDEIQTFGRTPELFAFQYYGLDALVDVVTIGKMSQICATFFTEAYNPQAGLLSQTFTASTSAIYAAKTILEDLLSGDYLGKQGKIAKHSEHFIRNLSTISKRNSKLIQGPFGFGAMIAFTALDGTAQTTGPFLKALFRNGVIAFPCGASPQRVRLLIPVAAVTASDIDKVSELIEKTLIATARELKVTS